MSVKTQSGVERATSPSRSATSRALQALHDGQTRGAFFSAISEKEFRYRLDRIEKRLDEFIARFKKADDGTLQGIELVDVVVGIVAERFQISKALIMSRSRPDRIAWARHICWYLLRENTELSLMETAKAFKRKDHTTVAYGYHRVLEAMSVEPETAELVKSLDAQLKAVFEPQRSAA